MFSRNVFGDQADARPAYDNVASAVFTSPQIATCGLTEDEAVAQHGDLSIFTSTYRRASCSCPTPVGPMSHPWARAGHEKAAPVFPHACALYSWQLPSLLPTRWVVEGAPPHISVKLPPPPLVPQPLRFAPHCCFYLVCGQMALLMHSEHC